MTKEYVWAGYFYMHPDTVRGSTAFLDVYIR